MKAIAYKLCRSLFIVATVFFLGLAAFSCVGVMGKYDSGMTDNQAGLLALGWAAGMIPAFFVWAVIALPLYLLSKAFRSGESLRVIGDDSERREPKI